jgi:hypothetical protein
VPALALVVAATLAACNGSNPTPAPASPGGSGAAVCTTAPAPSSDLPGWDVASQNPTLFPVIISAQTCGPNRLLFSFLDKDNRPVGAPDRTASIALFNLGRDPGASIDTVDGTFVWAIEGSVGVYVSNVTLPEAGVYGAEITTSIGDAAPEKIRTIFDVQASSALIKVGQPAPATTNPTLADTDGDVERISTDTDPEPALYQTSVAQAVAEHKPFLVAFATPKFCKTAQCGPTLDRIKPFVARYPGVAFINVEPYRLKFENGSLQADLDPATQDLAPVEAVGEWGLVSEPWVFVVDRDGIVRGSFGLIFSPLVASVSPCRAAETAGCGVLALRQGQRATNHDLIRRRARQQDQMRSERPLARATEPFLRCLALGARHEVH